MQRLQFQFVTPVAIAIFLCSLSLQATGKPIGAVTVEAQDLARPTSFVQFEIPDVWKSKTHFARDSNDRLVPLQMDDAGNAWLAVAPLAAGEERTIPIYSGTTGDAPLTGISAHRVGRKIEFWQGTKRILDYQAEPGEFPRSGIKESYRRGGYIHPIWSPDGVVVTDDFPENHTHHHGIWFPWTKTKFEGREPDFWNMGDESGRVEFVQLDRYFSGPAFAGLTTKHRFVDLLADGGKTVLNETWTVKIYAIPESAAVHMFDLESVQTCATDSPLILPQYRYGGLGVRGRGDWDGKENAHFLTSNGETDRIKGHTTRADWCYIGGDTGGKRTGIVIMCHPDNFRAPQPMRLHPTEPFFCFAPQQAGEMSIEPGKPYVSKYRFLVIDGEPSAEQINSYWLNYTKPPVAKVTLRAGN